MQGTNTIAYFLIFVGRAGAYTYQGAPLSGTLCQYKNMIKKKSRNKHPSLFFKYLWVEQEPTHINVLHSGTLCQYKVSLKKAFGNKHSSLFFINICGSKHISRGSTLG